MTSLITNKDSDGLEISRLERIFQDTSREACVALNGRIYSVPKGDGILTRIINAFVHFRINFLSSWTEQSSKHFETQVQNLLDRVVFTLLANDHASHTEQPTSLSEKEIRKIVPSEPSSLLSTTESIISAIADPLESLVNTTRHFSEQNQEFVSIKQYETVQDYSSYQLLKTVQSFVCNKIKSPEKQTFFLDQIKERAELIEESFNQLFFPPANDSYSIKTDEAEKVSLPKVASELSTPIPFSVEEKESFATRLELPKKDPFIKRFKSPKSLLFTSFPFDKMTQQELVTDFMKRQEFPYRGRGLNQIYLYSVFSAAERTNQVKQVNLLEKLSASAQILLGKEKTNKQKTNELISDFQSEIDKTIESIKQPKNDEYKQSVDRLKLFVERYNQKLAGG